MPSTTLGRAPVLESSAVRGSGAPTAFLLPTINEMIVGYTNENLTFDADLRACRGDRRVGLA